MSTQPTATAAPAPARAGPSAAGAAASHSDTDDPPSLTRDSDSGADDDDQLDDWSEAGDDEEEADVPAKCLFCPEVLATTPAIKAHFSAAHGFDFRAVSARLGLDFYQQMRIVNFVRERIAAGDKAETIIAALNAPAAEARQAPLLSFLFDGSETHFKPFLADDSLLFSLPRNARQPDEEADEDDVEEAKHAEAADAAAASSSSAAAPGLPNISALLRENQSLRNELESMAEAMTTMQAALKRVAFQDEAEHEAAPALATASSSSASATGAAAAPAAAPTHTPAELAAAKAAKAAIAAGGNPGSFAPDHVDRDYFGGYSTRNIHELMLRDVHRTESYRDFIYGNPALFKDKVVLDVGCGTGILSMFAAKAGARKVYAVDAADIVHQARSIISTNGLSSIIEVIHGKMEEVVVPEKVDIIISEWMGYFLLFESMLPSVLYARDKYLRAPPSADQPLASATGVYPDRAIMYLSGIETSRARREKIEWWSDVYGFDMSVLVDPRERFQGSTVEIIRPEQVITSTEVMQQFDCGTVKDRALDFEAEMVLKVGPAPKAPAAAAGSAASSSSAAAAADVKHQLSAFMVHFDTLFSLHCASVVTLTTAPVAESNPERTTHWQQAVFHLATPLSVQEGDEIKAKLTAKRMAANPRAYSVVIEWTHVHAGVAGKRCSQEFNVQ